MTNGDIRPQDYAAFKRAGRSGAAPADRRGVGLDPDFLWFNLRRPRRPRRTRRGCRRGSSARRSRAPSIARRSSTRSTSAPRCRSSGRSRRATARGIRRAAPAYPSRPGQARAAARAAGLTDRNGDGMLEDAAAARSRFSILTQAGHIRERAAAVIQEQLRQVGIARRRRRRSIPAGSSSGGRRRLRRIYFGLQASATDPALNSTSGSAPAPIISGTRRRPRRHTPWEQRIDDLMRGRRARRPGGAAAAFAEVQRIFGEELPAIYFVAPKVTIAIAPRVANPTPVPLVPQLLWSADTAVGRAATTPRPDRESHGVLPSLRSSRVASLAALLVFVVSSAALLLARLAPGDAFAGFDAIRRRPPPSGTGSASTGRSPRNTRDWLGARAATRLRRIARVPAVRSRAACASAPANTALLGLCALLLATLSASRSASSPAASRTAWSPRVVRGRVAAPLSVAAAGHVARAAAARAHAPDGCRSAASGPSGRRDSWRASRSRALPGAADARAGAADRGVARAAAVAGDARGARANRRARGARARRLAPTRVIWRHALRLSLKPVLAIYGVDRRQLLSGSFVVEIVMSWPGLGALMYEALVARDLYLVAGCAAAGVALSRARRARVRPRARGGRSARSRRPT